MYNTIHLVGLDVLIAMILDNLKCYFKNVVVVTILHFVIIKIDNETKNTLLIAHPNLFV
jgi:hypothetical protein